MMFFKRRKPMSNETALMELVNDCEAMEPTGQVAGGTAGSALATAAQLKKAGFAKSAAAIEQKLRYRQKLAMAAAFRYVRITDEKIQAFLNRKAEAYNREHTKEYKKIRQGISEYLGFGMALGRTDTRASYRDYASYVSFENDVLTSPYWGSNDAVQEPGRISRTFSASTIHSSSSDPKHIGRFQWTETPARDYVGVPPSEVVRALEEHQGRGIFDEFTVGTVEGLPDPMLMGRIQGVQDRFYIICWGDDVKLDDVI